MDWALQTETEWTVLKRIVSLLYSLADLAERAASRSPTTGKLALGILGVAESVARQMVIRDSLHFGVPALALLVADNIGDDADDATRLARRFRELALALESLVALILVAGRHGQASPLRVARQTTISMRPLLDCLSKRPGLKPVTQHDTS